MFDDMREEISCMATNRCVHVLSANDGVGAQAALVVTRLRPSTQLYQRNKESDYLQDRTRSGSVMMDECAGL